MKAMEMDPARQQQLLIESEIKSLLVRERYYRDTFQWDKLRECYHPDASKTWVNITWFTGPADAFVSGSQRMSSPSSINTPASHTLTPILVHLNPSQTRALTESVGSIRIRTPHTYRGVKYDIVAWGRFISRVERVPSSGGGGEWKMLTLEVIYERDSIVPVVPVAGRGGEPPEGFEEQTKGTRESYKCLGWVLASRGYKIDQELPGTDRPETVERVMKEGFAWLEGKKGSRL